MPEPTAGEIDAALAKQPGSGGEKMHVDPAAGQKATTRYRVLDHAATLASWIEFQPLTGRTHQIRVHAAALGHPIVGDAKYGGRDAFLTGGISRKMHLHARRLIVEHPDGGTLDIAADLPSHMTDSFAMLGFDLALGDVPLDEVALRRHARRPGEGRRRRRQVAAQGAARRTPEPRRDDRRSRAAGGGRARLTCIRRAAFAGRRRCRHARLRRRGRLRPRSS